MGKTDSINIEDLYKYLIKNKIYTKGVLLERNNRIIIFDLFEYDFNGNKVEFTILYYTHMFSAIYSKIICKSKDFDISIYFDRFTKYKMIKSEEINRLCNNIYDILDEILCYKVDFNKLLEVITLDDRLEMSKVTKIINEYGNLSFKEEIISRGMITYLSLIIMLNMTKSFNSKRIKDILNIIY